MSSRRPRVLLVAHHANPSWSSEPQIGWRWARTLDRRVDLTLVTHVRNRPAIEAARPLTGGIEYVDTERLARATNWLNDRFWGSPEAVNRLFAESLAMRAFDRGAVRIAQERVRNGEVDVIHRVSPISPRFPTRLGRLGVPFVLGPLNGGMTLPAGFESLGRRERSIFHRLRGLARLLDPRGTTYAGADCIVAATKTTEALVPPAHRSRMMSLCENGVNLVHYDAHPEPRGATLRVLYVGRLIPVKGVDHLLRAIRRLVPGRDVRLDLLGDGPERGRLEALAAELGVEDRVTFHGRVPVSDVVSHFERCHVFCLPSLRESGGAVVLEAMAAARPVVAVAHGGPAETVTREVGIPVAPTPAEGLDHRLADAIATLADDGELRRRLGRCGRTTVEHAYTWEAKVERMLSVYDGLLRSGRRAPVARKAA